MTGLPFEHMGKPQHSGLIIWQTRISHFIIIELHNHLARVIQNPFLFKATEHPSQHLSLHAMGANFLVYYRVQIAQQFDTIQEKSWIFMLHFELNHSPPPPCVPDIHGLWTYGKVGPGGGWDRHGNEQWVTHVCDVGVWLVEVYFVGKHQEDDVKQQPYTCDLKST